MFKTENKLKAIVIESLRLNMEPSQLNVTDLITAYSINSVRLMEILVNIEIAFDIEFEAYEISLTLLNDFNQLVEIVNKKKEKEY